MLPLSSTIALSRHQPSERLCSTRSVMGCLGTDNLSQPRDAQPSTSPLDSTTAVPAHQLSLFAISPLSWRTPRVGADLSHTCRLASQSRSLAQRVCLSLSSVTCEWLCNRSCVFQRQSHNQCIHVFWILSVRESRFVPSYRPVQRNTPSRPAVGPMRGKRLISNAPNTSSSLRETSPMSLQSHCKQHTVHL